MLKTVLYYLAIIFYLVMAYCYFTVWLDFFLQDEEMNLAQRSLSGAILVIGSILWPIVIPFAYLELLNFNKQHKKTIDILINKSNSKICDR
ncbi:hypothetical protein QUB80_06690 [Chlorogloeopsis sp. ULAP01]|uniref:hypothetical protein n=1 Tax=Chlorogloeopsis sp. ULAP01 TaxID=3056483 RepID=UPI0025AB2A2B|nr:hypothetical protein [Chlorogloeopsis sp. ULAP01]MDM9380388.1 hypothetical protein [Chlorogloeopsis sp. ULAP01]